MLGSWSVGYVSFARVMWLKGVVYVCNVLQLFYHFFNTFYTFIGLRFGVRAVGPVVGACG